MLTDALKKTATKFGCEVEVNSWRLAQVHASWVSDLRSLERERLPGQGEDTTERRACAIKHTSFLCYWLRRRQVINYIRDIREYEDAELQRMIVSIFGTEYFVLDLCYRLCLFGELVTPGMLEGDIVSRIQQHTLPPAFLREMAVLLYHKNVSPHSIYLAFKALLVGPGPNPLDTNVVSLASRRT